HHARQLADEAVVLAEEPGDGDGDGRDGALALGAAQALLGGRWSARHQPGEGRERARAETCNRAAPRQARMRARNTFWPVWFFHGLSSTTNPVGPPSPTASRD